MSEDDKLEKRALQNYREGQKQTDAVQARIRELDAAVPKVTSPSDDPKRGGVSPMGGSGWFKGFPKPAERSSIWNARRSPLKEQPEEHSREWHRANSARK